MAKSKGYRGGAFSLLVGTVSFFFSPSQTLILSLAFQFGYTVLTLAPMYFLWGSFWMHTIYLSLLIMSLIWAGASYYFEVFSERYALISLPYHSLLLFRFQSDMLSNSKRIAKASCGRGGT
jgi:hypothetical protein